MMSRVTAESMKFSMGFRVAMVRCTYKPVSVMSLLAMSKRSSSSFSLPKARMTSMPVRLSRATRFRRSVSFCMIWNLGTTSLKVTTCSARSSTTAMATIQLMLAHFLRAMMMPPTA